MIEGMTFLARDYEEVRDWLATAFDAGSAGQYLIDVLDDAIAADLSSRGRPFETGFIGYNPSVEEPTEPILGLTRRRVIVGGVAAAAAAATAGTAWALGAIDRGATVSERAVRLEPPGVPGFLPGRLYVALYGHPGSSTLGVLGEQDVDAAVRRAQSVAEPYTGFGRPVVPTFEIITTVASSSSGADGDYSNEFPASKFQPWIDAAASARMHVLLDLQPGRSTFPAQAAEIEDLLAQRHVSLALDPEWRVGPGQQPGGGRIGTVDGREVNETIDFLDEVVRRNGLPPKMLLVHQFTASMVTDRSIIRGTDHVQVVFQMDGFGSLALKRGSWDRMVADLPPGALTGWKNFYDEDRPTPTPAQTLDNAPTPVYVSYQ